ncbi:MAG: hypothetical protein ABSF09_12175 [Candidatus Bathyarchaeia archaeon]|jgi:hypothetical protein
MLEKLQNINPKVIFLCLVISFAIPMIYPIYLPIVIHPDTLAFETVIKGVPAQSKVIVGFETDAHDYLAYEDAVLAVFRTMINHHLRFVVYCFHEQAPPLLQTLITKLNPEQYGYKYGTDYALFGFVPGSETAMANVAASPIQAAPDDLRGTPATSLPIMQGVTDLNSFPINMPFMMLLSTSTHLWARQWSQKYPQSTTIAFVTATTIPEATPYYPQLFKGMIDGNSGGSELEIIEAIPGLGASILGAKNLAMLFTVALVVLGNIGYFASRTTQRRKEEKK